MTTVTDGSFSLRVGVRSRTNGAWCGAHRYLFRALCDPRLVFSRIEIKVAAKSREVGRSGLDADYAALTPATKVFTSLDSCSACFDTSDAAVRT